jgi:type VI secretion system protein ImpM
VSATVSATLSAPASGFFGKLPARGDFVRAGLPGGFVAAWDDWLQRMLTASRAALGDAWEASWLEAPVWRFTLAAGLCGPASVLGLWLPSVDRVGRYFPLTFARLPAPAGGDAWLDAAEALGRAALAEDMTPEALASALAGLPAVGGAAPLTGSAWWTTGAPRVAAARHTLPGLPEAGHCAAMLRDAVAP